VRSLPFQERSVGSQQLAIVTLFCCDYSSSSLANTPPLIGKADLLVRPAFNSSFISIHSK
jgi:hypothetical protein